MSLTSRRKNSVVLALAVLLVAALTFSDRTQNVAEASPIMAMPFSSDCVGCFDGAHCPPDYHDAYDWDWGEWTRNGGAHSSSSPCWDGTCAQMHGPNCSPSFTANDIEDVREAVLAGRADTVRRILAAHPEMVVNTERLAIQVEGCADQIIFHMPVSATFAARL